jgi:hypothetical protein
VVDAKGTLPYSRHGQTIGKKKVAGNGRKRQADSLTNTSRDKETEKDKQTDTKAETDSLDRMEQETSKQTCEICIYRKEEDRHKFRKTYAQGFHGY